MPMTDPPSTVLILSDDRAVRLLCADAIGTHCPGVTVASVDGEDPLAIKAAAGAAAVAIVGCDGGPCPGGPDAARRLVNLAKLRVAGSDAPALVLIPADRPGVADQALRVGADDVLLMSPGYLDQLPWRVRTLLGRAAMDRSRAGHADALAARVRELEIERRSLLGRVDALEALAATDPLTGLANRRAFDERLAQCLSAAARHDQPLVLLSIDVDGLKACNDALGHGAGDQVLRAAAQALRRASRTSDIAARLGGDELALILPQTDAARGAIVAARVLARFAELASGVRGRLEALRGGATGASGVLKVVTRRQGRPGVSAGVPTVPGLSIGLAQRRAGQSITAAALLAQADQALYRAKDLGGGRVEVAEGGGAAGTHVVTRPGPSSSVAA
jgi:diguanylate cyclase (GGDEF)-like protein